MKMSIGVKKLKQEPVSNLDVLPFSVLKLLLPLLWSCVDERAVTWEQIYYLKSEHSLTNMLTSFKENR